MRDGRHLPLAVTIPLVLILFCAFFTAGYGITSLIYRITGTPPDIWAHVLSGFTGILIFAIGANAMRFIFGKRELEKHWNIHEQMLKAMSRIARGDFDVYVNTQDDYFHADFAEAINKIARELGTMEQLRQDFISNVSHEIQSPLTSISGFTSLLRNNDLTEEQKNHYLDIIGAESKRLSALSDNLLKLSALETGNESLSFKEYRADSQLMNVALMLEPQWNAKNISLEANLTKVMVQADEDLLLQVWVNLLHNAVKFTPEGGTIHVTLQADETEIQCSIADTGIGISPEDRMHIFERFYKVDKSRDRALGGNGLGLSLAKKIVELHDGHISLQSEPGKGTIFTVSLPRLHSV